VPQFFRFGDRFEVELQSMAPLLPINRWLVKLNAFGSTNAMAALLGSLANSVPDLVRPSMEFSCYANCSPPIP
jgi:hypothetical protein